MALSVTPGGSAREIEIAGGAITHGKGVAPLELHGAIEALRVTVASRRQAADLRRCEAQGCSHSGRIRPQARIQCHA
jgi:hypothetical protein